MGIILIVILVLLLVGALPTWRHSSNWGPYPSGGLGFILSDRTRPVTAGADLRRRFGEI